MTPEGKVKNEVKKHLKDEGIFYFMPMQNGYGLVGIPDILACVPVKITPDMVGMTIGAFMGIETKAPGKEKNTTPNQKNVLKNIADCMGSAFVASDAQVVDDAILTLRTIGTPTYDVP